MRHASDPRLLTPVVAALLGVLALAGPGDPVLAAALAGAACLASVVACAQCGLVRLLVAGMRPARLPHPADAVAQDDGARFRCADPAAPGRSRPRAPSAASATA